jgi:hypothetical protein
VKAVVDNTDLSTYVGHIGVLRDEEAAKGDKPSVHVGWWHSLARDRFVVDVQWVGPVQVLWASSDDARAFAQVLIEAADEVDRRNGVEEVQP